MKIPGVKLYLCGGAVRDNIKNKTPKDMDYVAVTDLTFDQLVEEVKKIGTVFLAKPEFLTIRCKINNEVIDIALPRKESNYTDGRHPDTVTRTTLKEDAKRRDFTMNAMYEDEDGKIIDYFDGQKHLKQGILVTVGNPFERFKEDYVRIIRAIRFAIQLNLTIETQTKIAMMELAYNISYVVPDRIREELNKCFKMNTRLTAVHLTELGLWTILETRGLTLQLHQEVIE